MNSSPGYGQMPISHHSPQARGHFSILKKNYNSECTNVLGSREPVQEAWIVIEAHAFEYLLT